MSLFGEEAREFEFSDGRLQRLMGDLEGIRPGALDEIIALREDGMLKVASGMTSLKEVIQATMGDAD